ncbi:hypothetical protein E2C00_23305 [Streptomyces sp. WAC05374]|uniref:hypothetical protein n=1 Tax=Streptomyces sp. WAC05374 TaxID=2487420 RepID=UPI000F8881F8|nr:hypothetical protein [Streptomyces sp. WAC05374]RST11187.1 hypothetical protein EF905_25695 [Streptomyces sp. WAC05374]TDF46176.1 hypothetical protein E2B92_12310 [Streptomyces sp. WAC05374]TDF52422.1 hypothetical protein E2C00_23305 [Streptomyces sp. WAC05374]TDF58383.1 hypothetical protein E2C02_07695 [Streptomyces sp. WAC05374]
MKKILEVIGSLVLIVGVCGVLRELTGWFPFMGVTRFLTENVGFLHGRELFANIVIAVVGFAVLMTSDRMRTA